MSRPVVSNSITTEQITEIFKYSEEGDASKIYELFFFSAEIPNPAAKKEFLEKVLAAYKQYAASQRKEISEIELTTDGANILHLALTGGSAAIEVFLPHFDLRNENEIDALLASEILVMAATHGWDDVLQNLLARRDLSNPKPFLLLTNQEAFVNLHKTLLLAIAHDRNYCVETLLRAGLTPNIDSAIFAFSSKEIIYALLNSGVDVDKFDEAGFNFFDHFAIRIENEVDEEKKAELKEIYREVLRKSKSQKDPSDIEKKIEISINKWLAKLLYSEHEVALRYSANLAKIILDRAAKLGLQDGDIFKEILTTISEKKIFAANEGDHKFQIIESALEGHASYYLIEYSEDAEGKKTPLFVYYDDGNCIFSKDKDQGFGVAKFKVKEGLGFDDVVEKLGKITSEKQLKAEVRLGEIVDPEAVEFSVKTKVQKRGNCAMKSLMLLVELIGILSYGKDRAPEEWHDERKEFKHDMVFSLANIMKEFAKEGDEEAKKAVKEIKENAQRKWKKNPDELAAKILRKKPPTSTRTTSVGATAQAGQGCCVIS